MNETEKDMSDALKIEPNPHVATNNDYEKGRQHNDIAIAQPLRDALARADNDTKLLDWFERSHAQCWHDSRNKLWTVQVFLPGAHGKEVIQPSRATLRAAIADAKEKATIDVASI